MGYYLQDHPNLAWPQYGWGRAKIGEPGQHLSGVVGVHTSEAITDFEGVDNNAENNAAFLQRRTNYGSYTTSADADSIVPLVHPKYAAWADVTNNAHALSVSGCLQAARWLEMTPERRAAVVINMGKAIAREVLVCVREGYLAEPPPARRITAQQAIDGSAPGFYGHGETNPGTRYDPGQHFDWDLFLASYAEAVGGGVTPQGTTEPKEWDEMASIEEIQAAFHAELKTPKTQQLIRDAVYGELGSRRTQTLLAKGVLSSPGGTRDGKLVSVWRDLVDTNTIARTVLAMVQDLSGKIGKPVDITALDADAVVDAIAERLANSAKEQPAQDAG